MEINRQPILSALNTKAKLVAYNTTILTFFVLALVLGWFQYQNRSQVIQEKLSMDSNLIENGIRLGDQFFLTQYFSSFMASPLLDFGGIRDSVSGEWIFYPSMTRVDEKVLPAKISIGWSSLKMRSAYLVGSGSEKWSVIYVLNFNYFYLLVAFLVSLFVSLIVYTIVRSTLKTTGQYLVSPLTELADELDRVNIEGSILKTMTVPDTSYGFQETDLLLEKFNSMLGRIVEQQEEVKKAEVFRALNQLSRQVAHDVRSPLGALKTSIENIDRNPGSALALMFKAVARIESIMDDLKIRNEQDLSLVRKTQKTELVSFLSSFVKEKETEYSNQNVRINFKAPDFEIHRSIDRVSIERAFSNLINNSVEAVAPGSSIIGIQMNLLQSGKLQIEFSDNGPGISEELISKVFDFGFTSGKNEGTGMGLAQVKDAVEKHGGEIKLTRPEKGGLRVTIKI